MARMPKKTGRCEISGCRNTPTDWHHVISQNQIRKRGLPKSFFTDPGNLKEFCRKHHDMTTASMDRKRLEKQEKKAKKPARKAKPPKKAKKAKPKGQPRCEAMTEMFDRCKNRAAKGHHVCGYHKRRRKPGFRRKW